MWDPSSWTRDGINPSPLHWMHGVPTAGPPRKSLNLSFFFFAMSHGLWDLSAPRVEPWVAALEAPSCNHLTAREFPQLSLSFCLRSFFCSGIPPSMYGAQSLSCVPLFATPRTVARQAALSMGILHARTLEWVAYPFSRGSSPPRNRTRVSCIAGAFFTS